MVWFFYTQQTSNLWIQGFSCWNTDEYNKIYFFIRLKLGFFFGVYFSVQFFFIFFFLKWCLSFIHRVFYGLEIFLLLFFNILYDLLSQVMGGEYWPIWLPVVALKTPQIYRYRSGQILVGSSMPFPTSNQVTSIAH